MKMRRILLSGLVLLFACSGLLSLSSANAAEVKAAPKKAALKKEVVYVASKGSDKYHVTSCSAVAAIKAENKVTFASKTDAEKAGYKACGLCCKV